MTNTSLLAALVTFCLATGANAETWYLSSPATGKCYPGDEVYILKRNKLHGSIASPELAQQMFKKMGIYKGKEPLSVSEPERALIVRGRFYGDRDDSIFTYFRELDRCEEPTAKLS